MAVELLPEIKQELSYLAQSWQNELPIKKFKPENFHLTFLFLGNVPETQVPAVQSCLKKVAQRHRSFSLISERIELGPNLHKPRLIWLTIPKADRLLQLKKEMAECLADKAPEVASGLDEKQFFGHTHITIARLKQKKQVSNFILAKVARTWKRSLPVKDLILYESQLTPEGSIYTPLNRYHLKDAK